MFEKLTKIRKLKSYRISILVNDDVVDQSIRINIRRELKFQDSIFFTKNLIAVKWKKMKQINTVPDSEPG